MTVVDVGANIGYYTLLAASRVGPSGRVIAIEPSPQAFRRLAETISTNRKKLAHVQAMQIGLSDESGERILKIPPKSLRNHTPSMSWDHAPGFERIAVPVRPLDHCLDDWRLHTIDLLKIDVEGHEPFVLRGAAKALAAGRIRAVLCEFNEVALHAAGSSREELHALLEGFGSWAADGRTGKVGIDTRMLVYQGRGKSAQHG